ncbi:MAG: CPBP family intramembrane glutamic endopeptidase [Bacteroidales bacterium]
MGKGILQNTSPFTKLMFSAFFILASFLVALFGGLLLAMPIFDMGFMELVENMSNISHPDYANLLKYFQVVQSIGLFVIPPFILAWFFGGDTLRYLQLNKRISGRTIMLTTIIMISAIPLINLLAHLNTQISLPDFMSPIEDWMKQAEESAKQLTETFLRADTIADLLFNLFVIAVIPAIGEELLFRGVVQRLFAEWTRNKHAGIWISAIIFSAMHLQFFGFIPRMMLGVMFGYMLIWSGRMWIPITAHFVNNAVAVLVYFFIQKKQVSEDMETIGAEPGDWLYALLSLIFFVFFLTFFYRSYKKSITN